MLPINHYFHSYGKHNHNEFLTLPLDYITNDKLEINMQLRKSFKIKFVSEFLKSVPSTGPI